MSTFQHGVISQDYPENKSSWYLPISQQSVINQTNLKMVKANSPKHLVSVYKSTRRHIQVYSNLYFSVCLTPKPKKKTRSPRCFVHQCMAVCNAALHTNAWQSSMQHYTPMHGSLQCSITHQCKAVCNAALHINAWQSAMQHYTSPIKCLLSINRTSNIPFVLEHHLSTTDDSFVCVCVRAHLCALFS